MCVFFLVPFSCAFFVVHEEAMHMTSTPGFGVNCFFPFIFSLVFLTLGLFVIPRKFQVFFCYYLLLLSLSKETYYHFQKRPIIFFCYYLLYPKTKTNTNTHKHTHTYVHTFVYTYIHTSQIDFIEMDMVCLIYIMFNICMSHICMSHMVHDR